MKSNSLVLAILLSGISYTWGAAPSNAQTPALAPEAQALQGELERLNKNIERIAALLERSVEGQQLDLLIQRVEMGANRLSLAEQNLHSAKTSRNAIDDEKREIEMRLGQLASGLDSGDLDMPLEEIERYSHELDLQLTLLKAKVRDADRQIIELENEVMRQRGRVQDWQDYIDEKLTEGQ
jgi:chromosome segregation ATPase